MTAVLSIFHVPVDHLYVFFGEMSTQDFHPFLIGLFVIEFCDLFIYIRYDPLLVI